MSLAASRRLLSTHWAMAARRRGVSTKPVTDLRCVTPSSISCSSVGVRWEKWGMGANELSGMSATMTRDDSPFSMLSVLKHCLMAP